MTNLITTRPTLTIPKTGYGLTFVWEMFIPNLAGNAGWQNNYNVIKPIFLTIFYLLLMEIIIEIMLRVI
jgi:hypothetical protein